MSHHENKTCICARCARDISEADIEEYQESLLVQFRAGYGSVFGDGNVVKTSLCQHCVQDLLGQWITIIEDDPFEPKVKLLAPKKAYQPGQLE